MNGIVVSWIQVSAVTWVQPNPIPTDLVGLGLVNNRVQVRLGFKESGSQHEEFGIINK